jgi:hypothetical protein
MDGKCRKKTDRAVEDETLEEESNPAVASVGAQTDLGMEAVISMQEHYDETSRLAYIMENDMVPLYVHNAMQESHHRDTTGPCISDYKIKNGDIGPSSTTSPKHQCFSPEAANAGMQIQGASFATRPMKSRSSKAY